MSPLKSLASLRLAVVAVAGVSYAASTVPSVLGGDSGEMATLFATGGIAHPPGFPTMVLWLRAFHWLPCKSPAQGAALATAVAATLAVWALQRAALAWGASEAATIIASAAFAFSKPAWTLGSEAEVFALSALFAAVMLALVGPERRDAYPAWVVPVLGLVAGLSIGNHHTIVFLAPVGLLGVYRACRESPRPAIVAAIGALALFIGIAIPYGYAYVLARTADPRVVPMWIEAPTLEGLVYHFRRGAYGTFSLAPAAVAVAAQPLEACARFARSALGDLFGIPAFAALAVAASLNARRETQHPLMLFMLVLSFALCGPGFAAASNLPTTGLGARVEARFDLLPDVLLALLSALALDTVVSPLKKRPLLALPFVAWIAFGAAFFTWPEVARAHRPDVAHFEANVLATAPPDAIIVGNGDAEWGASLYARYAEKQRLDVAFINPGLLRQAWYRREVTDLTGVSFDASPGRPVGPKTMLTRLMATGRPVFYTDWPTALGTTPHDSYGPLMRPLAADAAPKDVDALLKENADLFNAYALDLPPPDEASDWGHSLYSEYGRSWLELAERFRRADRVTERDACLARVRDIAPWLLVKESPP